MSARAGARPRGRARGFLHEVDMDRLHRSHRASRSFSFALLPLPSPAAWGRAARRAAPAALAALPALAAWAQS
ncbi:hypothetical protein VXM49_22925, partial [Xanthomonas citri pv. citri]